MSKELGVAINFRNSIFTTLKKSVYARGDPTPLLLPIFATDTTCRAALVELRTRCTPIVLMLMN